MARSIWADISYSFAAKNDRHPLSFPRDNVKQIGSYLFLGDCALDVGGIRH